MKHKPITRILSILLSMCVMLTMLQVAYAADYTINITQQPTSSLTATFGESPGAISVEATTSNGAPIMYQWWRTVSGSNMTVGNGTNAFEIPSDLMPGTCEYYCELKAEGCDALESERTTVTVNKATYTGIQSDTFYVKADQSTLNNEYTLPNVPMSDMTYTIEDNGGNLVTGTSELKREASTDWRWILIFNTDSKPAGTEENIILKINGGYCYNDSSFTLTVKAGKQPVSITGIDGTDAEYSGNPQKGYTGEPQTGGFTGALNHHYNGRNTTVYDSGTAPTDAGDYTVTLSVPEDADYSGSESIDFSIKKKEISVQPSNYTMPQGQELPTPDSIIVNYIGFVKDDNSNNSISTWAVPKLNVSDSNTPGVSDIDFETEATLVPEKEKNYTLTHEKSELTIQARTYYVTVEGSYAPTSGIGDYYSNDTVNIAAGTRDGYTFVNWTSLDGVSFASPGSASTTFIMPGKDVTVIANWSYNGGSGGDSGGGGTTIEDEPSGTGDVVEPALVIKQGAAGKAFEVQATAGLIPRIVAAKAKGETSFELDITGALPAGALADELTVRIPQHIVRSLAGLDLVVNTPYGNLALPKALVETLAAGGDTISFTMQRGSSDTVQAQLAEGDKLQSEPIEITSSLQGNISVTLFCNLPLPTDPKEREAFLASLYMLAIHGEDDVEQIKALTVDIDETTQTLLTVSFPVEHFSTFALVAAGQRPAQPAPKLCTTIDGTSYLINGATKALDNTTAYRVNDSITVVAVRLLEELGAKISYKRVDNVGVVTVAFGGIKAILREKSSIMTVTTAAGESQVTLRTPFTNKQGRTYLPTRDIAENLGFCVRWAAADDSITIVKR